MPLKKAENPQESYKMDERQKNSFGIGLVVGSVMFVSFYWGVFRPSMDLVGSMGIGVGSGFSGLVVSYMMSRDE